MLVSTRGALLLRRGPRHAVAGLVVIWGRNKARVVTLGVSLGRVHVRRRSVVVGTPILIYLAGRVAISLPLQLSQFHLFVITVAGGEISVHVGARWW